jgi:DinB family
MVLIEKDDGWWEMPASFFDTSRSRAWITLRRVTHSAHHRGQQTALLRMLGRDLHSVYGPTADTGVCLRMERARFTRSRISRHCSMERPKLGCRVRAESRFRNVKRSKAPTSQCPAVAFSRVGIRDGPAERQTPNLHAERRHSGFGNSAAAFELHAWKIIFPCRRLLVDNSAPASWPPQARLPAACSPPPI